MTNDELLLAISNMMDQKLKAELQPIRNDLKSLKEEVHVLKGDLQDLKGEVQNLKEEVQDLKEEVQDLKEEVQTLKKAVAILTERVDALEERTSALERNFHQMQLIQKTQILPRLDTIESCYTDTFDRYKAYADKMDSVFGDVDLLKTVVTNHSERLQKLA